MRSQSTLTNRYQTTIPLPVRQALGLSKQDKICYTIQADGTVLLSRLESENNEDDDPVLTQFLDFLAQDLRDNPGNIQPISTDLIDQLQSLVKDVELDLDQALDPDDE